MFKTIAKLGLWLIVGAGSITALLGNTDFQTEWTYSFHSFIPAGTHISIVQPGGEPISVLVQENVSAGTRTYDIGAPATLAGMFLLGSVVAFGLKGRRPRCNGV